MAENRLYAFIPQDTVYSETLNKLPMSTRWIYVVLVAERHNKSGKYPMPYKRIRKITGATDPTIRKAIKLLESNGFLTYDHGGLEKNPNVYDLNNDWLEQEER